MEVKEKSKKRELIKTIAIIFLAVMLVLTFFSQTIMNHSLPEVATQMVTGGTINAKIRGSGTVAANESYEVRMDQTRTVRSVCVKVGDTVAQGDLLFVLEDAESDELKAAQEQLSTLELDYQKKILGFSKEYATDNQTVQQLREDLEKAIEERDKNLVTDEQISFAKGDKAAAEVKLSEIDGEIADLNALLSDEDATSDPQAQAQIDAWTKEVEKAKAAVEEATEAVSAAREEESTAKAAVTAAEGAVKSAQDSLDEFEVSGTVDIDRKIQDAQTELQKAQTQWNSDWLAYRDVVRQLFAEVAKTYSLGTLSFDSSTPQTISSTQQMYVEAYLTQSGYGSSAGTTPGGSTTGGSGEEEPASRAVDSATLKQWGSAFNTLIADQEDALAKQQALTRLQQDSSISSGNTAGQRQKLVDALSRAQSELSTAQRDLTTAQQKLSNAKGILDSAKQGQANAESMLENVQANAKKLSKEQVSTIKGQIKEKESEKREQTNLITQLTDALTALQEKQAAYKAALETIEAKERELETALSGKDIDKQLDNLDLQAAQLEIQKQRNLVAKYQESTVDTEINSNVNGVVSAINVSAGKDTTPDSALAVIDVVDRGYTIKIPVTAEQAKQVKIGDTADVTNYYWGNDITATLESIAPDPENPGKQKLLVFLISGEVDAGTSLSLSIGQKSANFDAIIPKSALRSDTNGNFVLVLTSRSTPLGNRYTATRADVQVLAEDDTTAAVSGLSPNNDYVITTSSKPLDAGTQVRMVEDK